MPGSGKKSEYPLGWLIRPDEGLALPLDGSIPDGSERAERSGRKASIRQARDSGAGVRPQRPTERGGSPIQAGGSRRSAEADADERSRRRAAGAHASPTSGPGAAASRRPPSTGPGALTPRTGRELERGQWGDFMRVVSKPADTISLILFLGMLVFALTWALRLLGWR